MSGLPKGWVTCLVGDVAQIVGGGTPHAADPANFSFEEGIPWLTPADLSGFNGMYISRGKRFLTPKGFENSSAKLMPKGTVLFSSRAPIGYVAIAANDICTNQGFKSFICVNDVLSEYLFFYLKYAKPLAEELASGTTFAEISGKNAALIPFLLPPINEQRRIVVKLEELLTCVDACQKRLLKIPVTLKRFRQAILAAACSGRLTADWREENSNNESASDLFTKITSERLQWYETECRKAIMAGKRKPKNPATNEKSRNITNDLPEIPEKWDYFRLEELCFLVTDGTHKTPQYQSSGIPFLSVKNVRPFLVRAEDIKHISDEEHNWINSRCNPEVGDILYTKVGATYGYAAINKLNYPFSIFVSLALLKPVSSFFTSEYAELVLNSEVIFNQARERVTGIGTPDLHLVEIRDFRTPLSPLTEQHEIVRRVKTLLILADQIEARYLKAKDHVDRLTHSVLARAFRGELVPQDENDEPASVLLERIRAQRAENSQSKYPVVPTRPKKQTLPPDPKPLPMAAEPPVIYAATIPQRILAVMQLGQEYSRADIIAKAGISEKEWTWAIRQLKDEGEVLQLGERRAARYLKA